MNTLTNRLGWLAAGVLALMLVASIGGVVRGGPLDPGTAPQSTRPPVEPRIPVQSLPGGGMARHVISAPGSYYLTDNITGDQGMSGIVITGGNVSVDLNGFAIIGGHAGSSYGIHGSCLGNCFGVEVFGGTISGWGINGVLMTGYSGSSYHDLRIVNNFQHGIHAGPASVVERILADNNGSTGILMGTHPLTNQGGGIVRDSVASNNAMGIHVVKHVLVINNDTYDNASDGILVTDQANRIEANNANFNNNGVRVESAGNVIIRNSARGNADDFAILSGGNTVGPEVGAATIATNSNPHANYVP